ncbi:MAG: choice-of-anchor Q domain-containing protein [Bacteroidota bacterium]
MNAYKNLPNLGGLCVATLLILFLPFTFFANTIIYVDMDATSGSDNGTSWQNAFIDLQSALDWARNNTDVAQIWVAEGTYYPTTSLDRDVSFELVNGIALYGGFKGNESSIADRLPNTHPTILDGDIGILGDPADNSRHIVRADGITEAGTLIDGFSITNGQADGADLDGVGAGLFILSKEPGQTTVLQVNQCDFYNNLAFYGGGLANYAVNGATAEPVIASCRFYNNFAERAGGAYHYKGVGSQIHADFYNCTWYENEAINRGGAIWGHGKDGQVIDILSWNVGLFNCILYDNIAPRGAAIAAQDDNSIFRMMARNCTFYNNVATRGDAVYLHFNGTAELGNCLVWEGTDFFYNLNFSTDYLRVVNSLVQDDSDDQQELDTPEFVDADARNFQLQACSPVIDKGVNYGTPIATDPLGNPREYGDRVDMGAYEFVGTSISLPIVEQPSNVLLADEAFTDINGWTHFYNCESDQLLLSLFTDGQSIGTPGVDGFEVSIVTAATYGTAALNLSQADYLAPDEDGWFVMNRYWDINNAQQPIDPVKVRFYFADQDVMDISNSLLNNTGTELGDVRDLEFFKVTGNIDPHTSGVLTAGGQISRYVYSPDSSSLHNWTLGDFNGQQYAEFKVSSFSGGSAGALSALPLPVELLAFEGKRNGQSIDLQWITTNEQNHDYFLLEKSSDARSFLPVAMLPAQAASVEVESLYKHSDPAPYRGNNYYRLKQVDTDGSYAYSNILTVAFSNDAAQVIAYPNPVNEQLFVQLPEEIEGRVTLEIWDALRRVVYTEELTQNTQALLTLPTGNLEPGLYTLKIRGKRYRAYHSFVKIGTW